MPGMARPVTCEHAWIWTKEFRIACVSEPEGYPEGTWNAECAKCKEKIWAHGRRGSAHLPEVRKNAGVSGDTTQQDRGRVQRQALLHKEGA